MKTNQRNTKVVLNCLVFNSTFHPFFSQSPKGKYCSRACVKNRVPPKRPKPDSWYLERLLSRTHIMPSGCVEWSGPARQNFYGQMSYQGKLQNAHRLSYMLQVGPIPSGLCVCHTCDNKLCINPKHLFLGTQKDNMVDAGRKGLMSRQSILRGDKHPRSKLLPSQVVEIFNSPLSQPALGRKYGISATLVHNIKHGKTWSHLTKHISTKALL